MAGERTPQPAPQPCRNVSVSKPQPALNPDTQPTTRPVRRRELAQRRKLAASIVWSTCSATKTPNERLPELRPPQPSRASLAPSRSRSISTALRWHAQKTRSDCQYTREDQFGKLTAIRKAADRPSRATLGRPNVQNFVSKKTIMAPSNPDQPPSATNGDTVPKVGPHPGFISSSNQYTTELKLRRMLKDNGCDPARQDSYRLQGVQLIENVREYLQL